MSEKPKALPGEAPKRETPKLQDHDWASGGAPDRFGAPAWLNSIGGTNAPVCRRCGCELVTGSVVFADVKIIKGEEYVYRLVTGKVVRSTTPLSCPLFAFDELSGAVEAKQVGREAKIEAAKADLRVDEAQARITQLEQKTAALGEAALARITQLERANAELRKQLSEVRQVDLTQLAQALLELAEQAKEKKALEPVTSGNRVLQIPKQLREVIDVVGIPAEPDEDPEP